MYGLVSRMPPVHPQNRGAKSDRLLEHWSRLGDAALAAEATQEAFIRGWRRLWRLGDGAKFADWTTSIARHTDISVTL